MSGQITNLLLIDYNLSCTNVVQSLIVSEYGLRHLDRANTQEEFALMHRVIGIIEIIPILGIVFTALEFIVIKIISIFTSIQRYTNVLASIPDHQWIFRGTQKGMNGSVPILTVESLRKRLKLRKEPSIDFAVSKISKNSVGGTCSAMSFEFAASYFKIKEECLRNNTPDQLISRLQESTSYLKASSRNLRTTQAAFNTITVKPTKIPQDYSKNKIQSLANFYDMRIDSASREFNLDKVKTKDQLRAEMDLLPNGLHLVRMLYPAKNDKLEMWGHTVIYIKEGDNHLFYDPNSGALNLSELDQSEVLLKSFKNSRLCFKTNLFRFYQLTPS